jgi:hypothetical protein
VNWFNLLASVRSAPLSCEYGIESILAPHDTRCRLGAGECGLSATAMTAPVEFPNKAKPCVRKEPRDIFEEYQHRKNDHGR